MILLYIQEIEKAKENSEKITRSVLGKYLGVDGNKLSIKRNKFGKPYLTNFSYVHFNVSHTKNVFVCAISKNPIGVDVERIRKIDNRVIRYYFSEPEIYYIFSKSENANLRFTEIWTKKEAYLKSLGTGISDPFIKFNVLEKKNQYIRSLIFSDYIVSLSYFINVNEVPQRIKIIAVKNNQF